MGALAGWDAALYLSGTATATAGEALSNTSGNVYIIDDLAKRIIDPATSVTIYENGVETVKQVTVNPLAGTVEFDSAPTEPVTADYSYKPRGRVGCPTTASINLSRKNLDKTCFKLDGETDAGVKLRFLGEKDASGEFVDLDIDGAVIDGTELLIDFLKDADTEDYWILEIQIGTSKVFRAFVTFESTDYNIPRDDRVEGTFTWNLASVSGSGHYYFGDYVADLS